MIVRSIVGFGAARRACRVATSSVLLINEKTGLLVKPSSSPSRVKVALKVLVQPSALVVVKETV